MNSSDLEFNEKLAKIAEKVFEAIRTSDEVKRWRSAYLDARFSEKGTVIWKIRVIPSRGEVVSLYGTNGTLELLEELWEIRDRALVRDWYGIKVNVVPSGECKVDFDYDPKCVADPEFFAD